MVFSSIVGCYGGNFWLKETAFYVTNSTENSGFEARSLGSCLVYFTGIWKIYVLFRFTFLFVRGGGRFRSSQQLNKPVLFLTEGAVG